ncbi:A24 family peptidase [Halorubrum sp. AJ67]|uniref:A24 family peptidase n=1 Tax=Halorubrum sp. AJ67 TaxID=1173487 RepID=UPI0003DC3C57|nr:A24 family peptidase [Halorubrum sp. AJ67]CDK38019.1 type IV leader peptidase family protein [Halorubrum sp. AJ67]
MIDADPDLLRLLAIAPLAWAAWSDHHTRRVDRRVWAVLIFIGAIAAVWQVDQIAPIHTVDEYRILTQLIIVPPATGFFALALSRTGAFGGADVKALFALGLVFPTPIEYALPALSILLPAHRGQIAVITIGFNAMLFGAILYLPKMWIQNYRRGERTLNLLITKKIPVHKIPETAGQMRWTDETGEPYTLDLDALRMYLRWKNVTVEDILQHSDDHRTATEIEAVYEIDEGVVYSKIPSSHPLASEDFDSHENPVIADTNVPIEKDDMWGAETFLDSITHTAYGTSPDNLRGSLEHILTAQSVRIQPVVPLVVPLFLGVVAAVTIGNTVTLLTPL